MLLAKLEWSMGNILIVICLLVLTSCSGSAGNRYITQSKMVENMEEQVKMCRETLGQLYQLNLTPKDKLKLEFFFYTDEKSQAELLASELTALGYRAKSRLATNGNEYVVNGWTVPIQLEQGQLESWVKQMCELGYKHECEFDGWGTDPTQIQ